MAHPLPALKVKAHNLTREIGTIRTAIASYEQPMDPAFVEFVESQGPTALADLQAKSAAWLREQRAELAQLEVDLRGVEENIAIVEPSACHKCQGEGEYFGPTSHYRGGRAVCFTCGGTGWRKGHRQAS
jgi:DnaJ-class molecular chaperone